MLPEPHVWIFSCSAGRFPGGAFTDLDLAKAWIARHNLTGVLTAYPLNEGCFDWAVTNDCTNLKPDKLPIKAADPGFVGSFTSASLEHLHFEQGLPSA